MAKRLEHLSRSQFGPRAAAYVASAVHASGPDLDWLESRLRDSQDAAMIDVGCGGGHVAYRASRHVRSVIACDPSAEMLRAVQATAADRRIGNITTAQAPAEKLPFDDGVFDVAATRFSAHHWSALDGGLCEVARVLRRGGRLLAVDAASPGSGLLDTHIQSMEVLRDASHVRNYTASEWVAALHRAGFAVTETRAARVRIEFASWVERMRTPEVATAAILHLQRHAPEEVRDHFRIADDGSFDLDSIWIAAERT
jgi:ubiquinone/menaquinone biosynthesis C-methylase UbiE